MNLENKEKNEGLSICFDISFKNIQTKIILDVNNLVIIELKQDGYRSSLLKGKLSEMAIHKQSFSKYCIGSALTNPRLKTNNFKRSLICLDKISGYNNNFLNLRLP